MKFSSMQVLQEETARKKKQYRCQDFFSSVEHHSPMVYQEKIFGYCSCRIEKAIARIKNPTIKFAVAKLCHSEIAVEENQAEHSAN